MSVSGSATVPGADTWFAIDDPSAVAGARRLTAAAARAAGFSDERIGDIEIVVSELASNLVKHAGGGDLVVRTMVGDAAAGLQVVTIDSGPGCRDIEALVRDGVSTRGTLGVGLGAARRLASRLELHSIPARGTIVDAVFLTSGPAETFPVSSLVRPLAGQSVSGDATAHRTVAGGQLVMVADGLGHGPLAALASTRATEVLATSSSTSPSELITLMHRALAGTRGAAITIALLDRMSGTLTHAGVGNVAGRLVGPGRSRSLSVQPGIVGHNLPRVRELQQAVDPTAALVLHSDGLTEKWNVDQLPDVFGKGPTVLAAAVLREAAIHRDDAGILALTMAP
jgi:anti-sigma regulatory factor (Ser/Thr protein kinase)